MSASGATPEAQADLLAALLDTLAIGQAAVIAISGGGPAAIHFALRHPTRCRALVLCSTVSRANTFKVPFRFQFIKLLARLPFARPVGLGPRILRAETAAIAALAVVQAVRGDWNRAPRG